jgi:uncharacterized oxidoreductase
MELAMKKAGEHGLAAVTLRNSCHLGRIGAYPLLAAEAGYIALALVNAGHLGYQIAPFGGLDGRLSTNPIAFAAPRRDARPIMVDMTTSVVAEGKVRVAINEGSSVPEGWLIDSAGRPTTDPRAFIADPPGAILPLGGVVAHKGYGLSIVVELMGGALSGEGCAAGAKTLHSNGVLFTVYNIGHFTERDSYYDELEALLAHIKSSRLAPGFSEILAPGEPEFRSAQKRAKDGIHVDETTWEKVLAAARSVDVDPAAWKL